MSSTPPCPPPGFDKPIAGEAAGLVQQAYAQFAQGSNWHLQGDYDHLANILGRATPTSIAVENFGFVARNKTSRVVFVIFRGTQTIEDWLSNLTFPQAPHPAGSAWGQIEKGFGFTYQECSASAVNGVTSAGPTPRIVVAGHSLGGALATLAAADLAIRNLSNVQLYSFASPRVGNLAFANQFTGKIPVAFRVANSEDIVTTVPLASPKLLTTTLPTGLFNTLLVLANSLDFQHVGVPVVFTFHNGSITANHDMAAYKNAVA
jgi:triacylglycerol lipase